jgi:hypothetical protein
MCRKSATIATVLLSFFHVFLCSLLLAFWFPTLLLALKLCCESLCTLHESLAELYLWMAATCSGVQTDLDTQFLVNGSGNDNDEGEDGRSSGKDSGEDSAEDDDEHDVSIC